MELHTGRDPRVFLVACLGGALSALDSTLNIAFPAVVDAFAIDVSSLQWVVVSYVLTYAALLLPFGRLADHAGRRRVMLCGLAVSAVALTACGVVSTFPVFLAARIAQGVGISLVLATAPSLVTLSVSEEDRARALGFFQMSMAIGFACGPVLGGLLLEVTSWRAVFLFRVPIVVGIAVLLLSAPSPDAARPARAVLGPGERRARAWSDALDLPGAATFAAGLASLLFVASRGSELGWASPATLGLVALAGTCLATFLVVEGRAPAPLVDLSLLRNPAFVAANVLNGAANATMFAIWLFGPTLLITVLGHDTIPGGALLGVTAAGTALAAPLAGRLTRRVGEATLSTIGLLVEAVGLAAASRVGEGTPAVAIVAAFGLVGAGLGLFQVPNLSYVMGSIPRSQQGVAGGMTQMVRTAGVVSGVAAANGLFVARRDAHARAVDATDVAAPELFTSAFQDVLVAAALVCAGAAALSLVRPRRVVAHAEQVA